MRRALPRDLRRMIVGMNRYTPQTAARRIQARFRGMRVRRQNMISMLASPETRQMYPRLAERAAAMRAAQLTYRDRVRRRVAQ